jgi:hypothetical protein
MLAAVNLKQLKEEARRQRRKDPNSERAFPNPPNRVNDLIALRHVAKHLPRLGKEAPTGICQAHPAAVTIEKGRAQFVFEITHAPADRRFLNLEGGSRLSEAAVLTHRNEVSQMSKVHTRT